MKLKRFKKITQAILVGSLLQAPIIAAAIGPSTGGGGHLSPTIPANEANVVRAVAASYQTLIYMLQQMEGQPVGWDSSKQIPTLLFKNTDPLRRNVLDELPKIYFEVRDDNGCIDPNTKLPAPGSYQPGESKICFSIPMILGDKPSQESAYEKVVELAGHELAHYMGADEPVALKVGAELRSRIHPGLAANIDRVESSFNGDFYVAVDRANQIIKDLADGDEFSEVCRNVDKMNDWLFSDRAHLNFNGVVAQLFRGAEQELFDGLKVRLNVLRIQCTKPKKLSQDDLQVIEAFGSHSSLPINKCNPARSLFSPHPDRVASRFLVSKPVYGSRVTMAREASAIKATALEIIENFNRNLEASKRIYGPIVPMLKKYCDFGC